MITSESPHRGLQVRTVKTMSSESSESKGFKEEITSSEEKLIKTVTTTSTSGPISEIEQTPEQNLISHDEVVDSPKKKKSKKKQPRVVKKKIIVYHTGSETAEEFLTEEKIREAIIGAGGKASSTARIVSSGETKDLEKFDGEGDVIEVKSITESSKTSERHETTSTESSTKHETSFETLEHIEIDPFSLITKPLEETFRRRMLEQSQEEKVSESKYSESKKTTEISKEETRELLKEKDTDTSALKFKDSKVATDAKKLVIETVRRGEEKSETVKSSTTQRSTERQISDSTTTIETRSEVPGTESEERTDVEESSSSKSFNIDEWDKPMGLPSPPDPLELEDNITSLTKQNTTTSTKQNGTYSNAKRQKSANETEDASPTKTDEEEKSEKEYESSLEKDHRQLDNKEAEKSQEPIYIDLTYVPHFGDPHYCNADFFRRIRSRYYVFSGSKPSKEVFNALLEAKQEWKDKDAKVTIIPTYETDTLGYWMSVNQEALLANNIDVAPSASRCTINLQDHETSCSAYRLEL